VWREEVSCVLYRADVIWCGVWDSPSQDRTRISVTNVEVNDFRAS
jgi:hypothetical protein